ncbi:MAG: hypothetical protein ACODAD_14395, partial [Planctomycetota bacterium]
CALRIAPVNSLMRKLEAAPAAPTVDKNSRRFFMVILFRTSNGYAARSWDALAQFGPLIHLKAYTVEKQEQRPSMTKKPDRYRLGRELTVRT